MLETGEPREVHHFCTLIGYGASAVNPYLAFETIHDQLRQGMITGDADKAEMRYVKAVNKGIVKVMSKMGISAVQSYHGAQIFEALGLSQDFIDEYFAGTPTRMGGVGIDVIAKEVAMRHDQAYPERPADAPSLSSGGRYKYRRDGEAHLNSPEAIHLLQSACRTGDYKLFKRYTEIVNDHREAAHHPPGAAGLPAQARPVPIEEVEPIEAILARFKTGAMSYGSISQEAHEALAIAMNRIGAKSNTGEGGEDPARYEPMANGDSKNSAIKQVASGRFGVTSQYLVEAKEIQIKMAQGAKPGEGGQLPGPKVYPWIAKVRYATPGVGLISPPPHHDIYSIEDLAQLIHDLKNANPGARISVKLVSESGVGTIAAGVAKAHADVILISGFDGGTGAAPLTSIRHTGAPWELGLAEAQQVLVMNNLRSRVVLETDGQLKSGRDVVVAALLGAEEFGFATAPLLALGCVMMRACHKNTCPVGVATQDPELRKRFNGDPQHVVNFMRFIAMEVRELMAQMGYRQFYKMVGRSETCEMRRGIDHWKARTLDFSRLLWKPTVSKDVKRTFRHEPGARSREGPRRHHAHPPLPAGHRGADAGFGHPAHLQRQPDRGHHARQRDHAALGRRGPAGGHHPVALPGFRGPELRRLHSQGAHPVPRGGRQRLPGQGPFWRAHRGLPPSTATFVPEENVVIGNVACYGATGGETFIRGLAGERFCVRNSGATAVVEGIGDHGCEYMTGGEVVILGRAGRNFGAGMSGGIAWVLDESGDFAFRSNRDLVGMGPVEDPLEAEHLKDLITRHATATHSRRAATILGTGTPGFPASSGSCPMTTSGCLESQARMREKGLPEEEAVLAAFEENARSLARADGN